ncbi:MAG TPA: isoprenylcysteine carboxylmethyltransferase family protein [Myxococcota bacterium]|jgi:protein-S-isoprenylcysteine O-methyltransferase Ste14|nr:isoprenylcysteine carboxylmethyltransferase family protein [Myxococcota bacterium]
MSASTHGPADAADVRVLPPLLFLASIALGVVLGSLLPLRFHAGGGIRVALGVGAIALGVALAAWTIAWMRRTHQDPDPRKPTPELILAGPFRLSRNPIYVGMALVQLGVGVALGNLWVLLLLPPTLYVLVRQVVEREEAYLARKFGEPYEAYRRSVRRWL